MEDDDIKVNTDDLRDKVKPAVEDSRKALNDASISMSKISVPTDFYYYLKASEEGITVMANDKKCFIPFVDIQKNDEISFTYTDIHSTGKNEKKLIILIM